MYDYLSILIYLIAAATFATIFSGAAFLVAVRRTYSEKTSSYECGFDPFDDARSRFDVRFYLVALLFLIMDLEILFCFPYSIALADIGDLGYWVGIIFILILTVGFIYEWSKGALDWS
uniref:NADH dehydrogenase subunit 3 n=1 Tax=Gayralia brasiliensis TaxID=1286870 RepID=UPI0024112DBA|nr:NADH dehydrogenase subunit 3 [Gayralia brasiliensis]YP_010733837.1 NADH dehydrogenase subunit 3 [Monostroma nitidum]WEG93079.1 NADH dehydrogenase subunit 3 [Gayralia brasiliensis]WEG93108.1 NADH dehydrogenase subunit 3 [Monostroma nitidum]